ncbi:hypothetical protein BGAFAR04_K0015 (plasmid) [Borreliella garinii Far04]|nr:hypothetical protein BGAFAR04_K0015 [Borreliella garinii Far04]
MLKYLYIHNTFLAKILLQIYLSKKEKDKDLKKSIYSYPISKP